MARHLLTAENFSKDHLLVKTEDMTFSLASPQLSLCWQSHSLILQPSHSFPSGPASSADQNRIVFGLREDDMKSEVINK